MRRNRLSMVRWGSLVFTALHASLLVACGAETQPARATVPSYPPPTPQHFATKRTTTETGGASDKAEIRQIEPKVAQATELAAWAAPVGNFPESSEAKAGSGPAPKSGGDDCHLCKAPPPDAPPTEGTPTSNEVALTISLAEFSNESSHTLGGCVDVQLTAERATPGLKRELADQARKWLHTAHNVIPIRKECLVQFADYHVFGRCELPDRKLSPNTSTQISIFYFTASIPGDDTNLRDCLSLDGEWMN